MKVIVYNAICCIAVQFLATAVRYCTHSQCNMVRRLPQQKRVDMVAAAQLLAEGKTQVQIAKLLNVDETDVSRLLRDAEGRYFSKQITFLAGNISEELRSNAQKRVNRTDLAEKLHSKYYSDSLGPTVRVFSCSASPGDRNGRISELSRQAAPYVKDLILRANLVA